MFILKLTELLISFLCLIFLLESIRIYSWGKNMDSVKRPGGPHLRTWKAALKAKEGRTNDIEGRI